jgi:Fe-S-cluster containining protein
MTESKEIASGRIKISRDSEVDDLLKLSPDCGCDSCKGSCRFGSGFAVDEDLPKIAAHLNISVEDLKSGFLDKRMMLNTELFRPKIKTREMPFGECVFFDDSAGCRIHDVKPLQCRLAMGCRDYGDDIMAWFLVNHFLNPADPQSVREYDSYIKTGGKVIPGADIKDICPDDKLREDILSYARLK